MNCPFCGAQIIQDAKFCHACGANLQNNKISTSDIEETPFFGKRRIFFSVLIFIFVLASCLYVYLAHVGSTINLDDSNVPEIMPKADNCNSPYVENEVVSIFKANDFYFKHIDLKSIDSVRVQSKDTLQTGDNRENYLCSGIIEMKSDSNGFKPSFYNNKNDYYEISKINEETNKIKRFTIYEAPVLYSSNMENGKNRVEIVQLGLGDFACHGVCTPTYRFEQRHDKSSIVSEEQNELNVNNLEKHVSGHNEKVEVSDDKTLLKKEKKKKKKRFRFRKKKNDEIPDII